MKGGKNPSGTPPPRSQISHDHVIALVLPGGCVVDHWDLLRWELFPPPLPCLGGTARVALPAPSLIHWHSVV